MNSGGSDYSFKCFQCRQHKHDTQYFAHVFIHVITAKLLANTNQYFTKLLWNSTIFAISLQNEAQSDYMERIYENNPITDSQLNVCGIRTAVLTYRYAVIQTIQR